MDLLIKNGLVYDPVQNSLTMRDIGVENGKITNNLKNTGESTVIDAKGCYVLPAMIDSHAHVNRYHGGFGTNADLLGIPNGVSTLIDAGSLGIDKMEEFITQELSEYEMDVKVLLHAASGGQSLTKAEILDDHSICADGIINLYEKYPHIIKGLKIRYENASIGNCGLQPLQRCTGIADELERRGYKCPLTVHLGDMNIGLSELLDFMRPGDILAHIFRPKGESIFEPDGKIKECVKAAKEKGIRFDFAHGRMNFTFENVRRAAQAGFWPDLLGTDIHGGNIYKMPAFSMMNTLTMMNALGMPIKDIFKAVTYTPALIWGFSEAVNGFKNGDDANISIIYAVPTALELSDINDERLKIKSVFCTKATIREGRILYCQASLERNINIPDEILFDYNKCTGLHL